MDDEDAPIGDVPLLVDPHAALAFPREDFGPCEDDGQSAFEKDVVSLMSALRRDPTASITSALVTANIPHTPTCFRSTSFDDVKNEFVRGMKATRKEEIDAQVCVFDGMVSQTVERVQLETHANDRSLEREATIALTILGAHVSGLSAVFGIEKYTVDRR